MRFAANRSSVLGLLAAAVLAAVTPAASFAAEPVTADSGRVVVMISIDGLAGHYLDDPKAEMPTIRELAKEGARAASMKAVAPTVTWPNHTTLVTGDYPARHGVVGNNYFDRKTGKRVTLIADPVYGKDEMVKVPTIYDLAKDAGLRTAGMRWPMTRGAKALDWNMPDILMMDLLRKYTTPSLLVECRAAGFTLDTSDPDNPKKLGQGAEQDELDTRAFNLILREHRPNLALLHLINVDHQEHLNGPRTPEAYAAIKGADAQVKEVWDELKRDYPGKATLIVTSDHGFSPINRMILPNNILAKAGLVDVKGTRVVGGSVHIVAQGGAEMVYIADDADRAAVVERVRKAFDGVDGVAKVVGPDELKSYGVADPKDDPHAPDMILFAKLGYSFGDTAGGALSFIEKPERSGTHGHDPNLPELHAAFVAWGVGIQPGARVGEIKNIDVAPTVAKLLGIDMNDVDGKPLDGVLSK